MVKRHLKITAFLCIVVITFAVGVTAVHHHLPEKNPDHDCNICSFINVLNTAISPVAMVLWVLSLFAAIISALSKGLSYENVTAYSSRAPPFILL